MHECLTTAGAGQVEKKKDELAELLKLTELLELQANLAKLEQQKLAVPLRGSL